MANLANRKYLVYLNWPERCFRAEAREMAVFKRLVPKGVRVVRVTDDASFLRELPSATHVVTWHFWKEWFPLAPKLEWLATPSAGRELIAWREAPETVRIHFGGFHGKTMSEAAVGFMLAWAHGFFLPEIRSARYGDTPRKCGDTPHKCGDTPSAKCGDTPWKINWPRAAIGAKCHNLCGSLAVIVGYGKVGRAIGSSLESLGVKIMGFGRSNISELPKAVKRADWLILALPSDTGTDHFLDSRLIDMLPRKCVVVNVGRGNAVDESAILEALRGRRLAGAYLDVFCREPINLPFFLGSVPSPEGTVPMPSGGSVPSQKGTVPAGILDVRPSELPENLIIMPHSSAFSDDYLIFCFKELKDDGFF